MRFIALAAASLVAGATASTPTAAPSYDSYKSWYVACDNGLSCEAKGFTEGDADGVDLRIARNAGPNGTPEVQIGAAFTFSLQDILVDGVPLRLTPSDWSLQSADDFTTLSGKRPAAVHALIARLRNASRIEFRSHQNTIPLEGMVAALLRMDERQGRLGGVTALIRTGPAPVGKVPQTPPLPVIFAHPVTEMLSDSEARRLVTSARAAEKTLMAKLACATDTGSLEAAAFALDARHALVVLPCMMGAYQGASLVVIASRTGDQAPLLFEPGFPLQDSSADTGEQATLVEPDFDPKTGILATSAKGRGLADCGMSARWAWDGRVFRLTDMSWQSACGGSGPGDWPVLFRSIEGGRK